MVYLQERCKPVIQRIAVPLLGLVFQKEPQSMRFRPNLNTRSIRKPKGSLLVDLAQALLQLMPRSWRRSHVQAFFDVARVCGRVLCCAVILDEVAAQYH